MTNGSTGLRSPANSPTDDKGAAVRRDAEERRAVRRTTVERRVAYTDARRAAHLERDAERLRLAQRFATLPGPHIPRDDGYLVLAAGTFSDLIDPAVAAANRVIDEIGHTALVEHRGKSDFIAQGFLPDTAFAIGSGPLTAFSASDSARLADAVAYNYGDGYRVADDRVNDVLGPERQVVMTGPRGTVDFIDTCRCFHFGSRVSEDGEPRRLLMVEYPTPYAFEFANHRKEARYRTLAASASNDLQRLLLGGA